MSKHAIESYTDTLAAEMEKFGVHVSVIEPGNYNSSVMTSMQARMEELGRTAEGSLFEEDMQRLINMPTDRSRYKEPDEVSAAAMHAMFDDNPKRRYMVVPDGRSAEITIRQMINELVQLNDGQEYTFDREALIEMLDEALATSKH